MESRGVGKADARVGDGWMGAFERRHPENFLKLGTTIDAVRVMAKNPENALEYFNLV